MNATQDPPCSAKDKKVLLMGTCLCDAFYADAAIATVEILEHLGVEVIFPEDQTCCGQPAFNMGDWKASRKVARHTLKVFEGDLPIIVPSGSCAGQLQHGNLLQFEKEDDLPAIKKMGQRTWELTDYIVNELGITTWPGKLDARIAFHHSCHTLNTGTRPAAETLLKSIEGITLIDYGQKEQCCGFGGTFCVTFPNISGKMGTLKLTHLLANNPDFLCAADLSCMMHLGGLAEKQGKPIPYRHIAQVLMDALKNS